MPITKTSKQFLQTVFGMKARDATVEWWHFDKNSKAVGRQHARAVAAAPGPGDSVYWSVGLMKPGTTRGNTNVEAVYALVADDVGTKVDEGLVGAFMPTPTMVVETSSGNFQYVWAVPGGMTPFEHLCAWRGMEERLGRKMDGSDISHLFRLPEGINGKPGKHGYTVRRVMAGGPVYGVDELPKGSVSAPGARGSGQKAPGGVEAVRKLLVSALQNPWDGSDNSGLRGWWIEILHGIKGALVDYPEEARELAEEWSGDDPDFERVWDSISPMSAGWGLLEIAAKQKAPAVMAGEAFDDGVGPPPPPPSGSGMTVPLSAEQLLVADWIVVNCAGLIKFNVSRRIWMVFESDIWEEVHVDAGFNAAQEWARGNPTKAAKTAGFARGVSEMLRNDPRMIVVDGQFNRGGWLYGVPGGVLNMVTGAVRPGRASDMISKRGRVAPDSKVACPAWLKFLAEATQGDAGMLDFLQRWAGYCLTGDVRAQKFVYLWGPGGNGKSLFVDTLRKMMGDYAVQAASDLFVKKTQKGHPDALARLAGARLVVVPEISGGDMWDVDLLKEVTGNELMVARFMYGSNFTFPVTFKIMSTGNHQPRFPGGVNPAIERRFIYGKFENMPSMKDERLAEKFEPEMPGIMAWALEGLMRGYKTRGLAVPQSMAEAAQEYFDETDAVLRWKAECLQEERGSKVTVEELFRSWDGWAAVNGEHDWRHPSTFGKMLRNKGLFKIVVPKGKPTINGWKITNNTPF
jgi:putative DNA primase/helicase